MLFKIQNMPRWLIFSIDISIVPFSIVLAYLLRFNFQIPASEIQPWTYVFPIMIGIRAISFVIAKIYSGIIRYTSTEDAIRIFIVIFLGSIFFSLLNIVFYYFINEQFIIPFSVIIMEFLLVIFSMVTFRIIVKIAYLEILNPGGSKNKVIIFGAGEAGIITKRALDRDVGIRSKVIAFIDEDKSKLGKKIEGVNIHGLDKLDELLAGSVSEHLVISCQ